MVGEQVWNLTGMKRSEGPLIFGQNIRCQRTRKETRFTLPCRYTRFDQVRRKKIGLSFEEYRQAIAELLVPFSQIASNNPYAQFPKEYAAQFIASFSEENFPICEPYSKWMVAQTLLIRGPQ